MSLTDLCEVLRLLLATVTLTLKFIERSRK